MWGFLLVFCLVFFFLLLIFPKWNSKAHAYFYCSVSSEIYKAYCIWSSKCRVSRCDFWISSTRSCVGRIAVAGKVDLPTCNRNPNKMVRSLSALKIKKIQSGLGRKKRRNSGRVQYFFVFFAPKSELNLCIFRVKNEPYHGIRVSTCTRWQIC